MWSPASAKQLFVEVGSRRAEYLRMAGLKQHLLTRSFHRGARDEQRQGQPLQDDFRLHTEMHLRVIKGRM